MATLPSPGSLESGETPVATPWGDARRGGELRVLRQGLIQQKMSEFQTPKGKTLSPV